MMNYLGINRVKVEGNRYETMCGISNTLKVRMNGRSYIPLVSVSVNMWGIKNEQDRSKVFAKIEDSKKGLCFSVRTGDVECPSFVCGYPSLRIGKSPWDKWGGFELGQVKSYGEIKIGTEWSVKIRGEGNLVYDAWVTKNRTGELTSDDIEIMVWLSFTKKPTYWTFIGECEGLEVYYKRKGIEWNNGGHVFAFVNNKKKLEFDLKKLILYCKEKVKGVEKYWLRTIELGTEFTKNTNVEIKVKKINIGFKKRSKRLGR